MKKKSPLTTILWGFRKQWQYARASFVFTLVLIPIYVVQQFITIYLPKSVVAQVLDGSSYGAIILQTGLLIGVLLICSMLNQYFDVMGWAHNSHYRQELQYELLMSSMKIDYQVRESAAYQDRMQRAQECLWASGQYCPTTRLTASTAEFIRNILGYLLFGTVVSFVSPWITLILTVTPIISLLLMKRYNQFEAVNRENWTPIDRKLWYIAGNSRSFNTAKDIRIYGLNTWFTETFKMLTKERLQWDRKLLLRGLTVNMVDLLIILLRDGAAYYILITMTLRGEITVDEFILYFAAIGSFATWIGGIINNWSEIHRLGYQVSDLRETIAKSDTLNRGEGICRSSLPKTLDIQIENLSYQYEGAEQATLKNINLHIQPGEKLAVVGLNGAGKTTLIRNICGLYTPTDGQIRIGGHSRDEFNINEYYSLFSMVSQNLDVMAVSIGETVSSSTKADMDRDKVMDCLEKAGLADRIKLLPEGIDTPLNKQLYENGIDLSGGEKQKLLLAKAIYKDAPILILDEPTSALDPIAESTMYMRYNELTEGRTSIFISHRLASTRFCDRIILVGDGEILELGSHEELMKLGGRYAELYEIQSKYYKEGDIRS